MVEHIDMTPTWSEILPALFLLLEEGNDKGKTHAKAEITRMAILADAYNRGATQND